MRRIETRLVALEALERLEKKASYHDFRSASDAFRRLMDALRMALPETETEIYRYGVDNLYTGIRGHAVTHAELLPPIVARIEAGTPTVDDNRIVAALPVADLAIYGTTAGDFLRTVAYALNKF